MIARGFYARGKDPLASTEFTYSRFLTPALAGFKGWALFCDSDFLWLHDIAGLAKYAQGSKAVQCVQHDYTPKETTKMDGAVQTAYPRKNWSSLMLFNCEHPSVVKNLTPEIVNRESGAYLHRMQWVADEDIGALAGDLELARGLERETENRHARRGAFHPRRSVVRELAECRLWRPLARRARADGARHAVSRGSGSGAGRRHHRTCEGLIDERNRRRYRNLFAQQSVAALPRTHRALCAGACRRIARPEHQGARICSTA